MAGAPATVDLFAATSLAPVTQVSAKQSKERSAGSRHSVRQAAASRRASCRGGDAALKLD